MVIASARLDQLRASPFTAPLLLARRELAGIGSLADVCGFDPVAQIDEVAIAVPDGSDDPDVGVVAVGALDARALAACAARVIERRGKSATVEERAGFTVVREKNREHVGQIAVKDGGPLFLGGGAYLEAMMHAAETPLTNAPANEEHRRERERFVGANGAGNAVVVTAVFSEAMRNRARSELAGGRGIFTRVTRAALSLTLAPTLRLQANLGCETPADCSALAELAELWKSDASGPSSIFHASSTGWLDRAEFGVFGKELRASAELRPEEAARLVDEVEAFAAKDRETRAVGPKPAAGGR